MQEKPQNKKYIEEPKELTEARKNTAIHKATEPKTLNQQRAIRAKRTQRQRALELKKPQNQGKKIRQGTRNIVNSSLQKEKEQET